MFIQPLNNRTRPHSDEVKRTAGHSKGHARFQRDLGAIAITLLVASIALGARADTIETPANTASPAVERIATSRGYASDPQNSTGRLPSNQSVPARKPRDAKSTGVDKSAKYSLYGDFDIFDADVTLYYDDDYDGHYYGIDVNFDADTDYVLADVYARLYFSLEGEPWELYHTTEIFTLIGDTGSDDYTVETELYSGYPTAYYDVLIELYDADTGDLVAEFGPADSIELDEIPLEDQQKDLGFARPLPTPIVSHSHGGGGATTWPTLALLLMIAALRGLGPRARAGA